MVSLKDLITACAILTSFYVQGFVHSDEDIMADSGDKDLEDSSEHIGAAVTQVFKHPYAASLLENNTFICSGIILNSYWLLTLSRCFSPGEVTSYVTQWKLNNFTVRVGSSYNNKGGSLYKIKMLINHFDLKVSAAKLDTSMTFSARVKSVILPTPYEEPTLGFLVTMIAWTPQGHIRTVNAPVIESAVCDANTALMPGQYICVAGVQDPDRHFCRRDGGGAVVQNNTLIGISSFQHTCALYTKTHAFPKVSSFATWLDSVIWDENNRPTTSTTTTTTKPPPVTTEKKNATAVTTDASNPFYADPYMLTLPYEAVNVPLVPAEDNSVLPRMSLYESYLHNLAKAKTSTTNDPNNEEQKAEWLAKYNKAIMMRPPPSYAAKKFDMYDYS